MTIFSQIRADFLYQERHYTTSAIKNYLFKKFGGSITSSIQKNIIHLHDTGFYINTDIFFSLGKKTYLTVKFCGAKIKKIIPVGSTFLEANWFKSEKANVPDYDIVDFGGNNMMVWATNKNYKKNYHEHFEWLVKISKEFPNLRIAVKHHFNNHTIEALEASIFKGSSIKIITSDKIADKNYSYGYAFKAKFSCTYASTIAYELIGHDKHCFFLDPQGKNIEFLNNETYNESWKIKSYEDFKKKVEEVIFEKIKIKITNSDDFCLKSENVSSSVFKFLKNSMK